VEKTSLEKPGLSREAAPSAARPAEEYPHERGGSAYQLHPEISKLLPCVLYQADNSLQLSYVSENIAELLGVESRSVLQNRLFWDQRIFAGDLALFAVKIEELQISGSAALIHRMTDVRERPVWVAHRMKKVRIDGAEIVVGSLTPVENDSKIYGPDPNTISRFVHKLGNHFQMIALAANSLSKMLPGSQDIPLLQEAIDRAIELVRAFSDYSQPPACLPHIDFCEVVKAAVGSRRRLFEEKGIGLEEKFAESLEATTITGDAFLLESAIGHIIQNALEATQKGGIVSIVGAIETDREHPPIAKLRVADVGCGIDHKDLAKVMVPFFTSKKDHDGLGLTLSARFVELHGGSLKIRSAVGRGTEVEITLPIISAKDGAF
jgi:signal transduction histidine kinase